MSNKDYWVIRLTDDNGNFYGHYDPLTCEWFTKSDRDNDCGLLFKCNSLGECRAAIKSFKKAARDEKWGPWDVLPIIRPVRVKVKNKHSNAYRLPDGEVTYDVDLYLNSWNDVAIDQDSCNPYRGPHAIKVNILLSS